MKNYTFEEIPLRFFNSPLRVFVVLIDRGPVYPDRDEIGRFEVTREKIRSLLGQGPRQSFV